MTTLKYNFPNYDEYSSDDEICCDKNGFDRNGFYRYNIRHDWVAPDDDRPKWYRPEYCNYCDYDIHLDIEGVDDYDHNYVTHLNSERHIYKYSDFLEKGKVEDENEEYTCVICNITTWSATKHNRTESHKLKFLEQERQEAEDTEHYCSSI